MPQLSIDSDMSSTPTIITEPSRKLLLSRHSSSSVASTSASVGEDTVFPIAQNDMDDDVWALLNSDISPDVEDFSISLASGMSQVRKYMHAVR